MIDEVSPGQDPLRSTQSRRIRRVDEIVDVSRERLLAAVQRAKTAGIAGIRDKHVLIVRPSSEPECYDLEVRDDEFALPPATLLRDLYDLTITEARVALAIAEGANAKDLAERFSISNNTARVHVQRILSKTACSRQTHLIRLLLSLGSASSSVGESDVERLHYVVQKAKRGK